MNSDEKKSGDTVKFEVPMTVLTGLLSLYLLRVTIVDYQEKGPTDLWTIFSGIFFLVSVVAFVQALRKKAN